MKKGKCPIGGGMPVVCVPIVEKTADGAVQRAEAIRRAGIRMVEWRADFYEGLSDPVAVQQTLGRLRDAAGDMLLLFTVRTRTQGGEAELKKDEYRAVLLNAAHAHAADLIDVEYDPAEPSGTEKLLQELRRESVWTIGSCHDFMKTPSAEELQELLYNIKAAGADIVKLAVMPQNTGDLLRLLSATNTFHTGNPDTPLITMSMGRTGVLSRITGEIFGSAVTFGSIGQASAPGQIPAEKLRQILTEIHEIL